MKDSTFFVAIFCIAALLSLAIPFYLYTASVPNPAQDYTESYRPHFIHPRNANCVLVVGTEDSDTQVYLCKTVNDEYFYVRVVEAEYFYIRVVEATTISGGKVWTKNKYAE